MGTLPRRAFRSLVAGLDGDAFTEFVAALWEARGYEVTREGDRLRTDEGQLYPVPARLGGRFRPLDGPGEATVVLGDCTVPRWARTDDVEVVDADELYELVRYGISTAEREAIFADVFDRSPEATSVDRTRGRWVAHRFPDSLAGVFDAAAGPPIPSAGAVRVALVVAVVVVALLAGGGLLQAGIPGGPFAGADSTATATPVVETPTTLPLDTPQTPSGEPDGLRYPPGVNETGITNVSKLLVAHVRAVGDTSYKLVLVYRAVGDDNTVEAREVVHRAEQTTYVTDVERDGDSAGTTWPVADREVYADGVTRYVRRFRNGSVAYRATGVYSGFVGRLEMRASDLLDAALSGAETRVVDTFEHGRTDYLRIRFENAAGTRVDAYGTTIRNGSGTLVVSERGVVQFFTWSFVREDTGARVVVKMQYLRLGVAEVDPPAWLDEAQNRTDDVVNATAVVANETDGVAGAVADSASATDVAARPTDREGQE